MHAGNLALTPHHLDALATQRLRIRGMLTHPVNCFAALRSSLDQTQWLDNMMNGWNASNAQETQPGRDVSLRVQMYAPAATSSLIGSQDHPTCSLGRAPTALIPMHPTCP